MNAAASSNVELSPRTGPRVVKHVSFYHPSPSEDANEFAPLTHTTRSIALAPPLPTTTTTKKAAAPSKGDNTRGGAAASRNGARHLATAVNDPRQWILALGQQSTTPDSAVSSSFSSASALAPNENGKENSGIGCEEGPLGHAADHRDNDERGAQPGNAIPPAATTTTTVAASPPLEERIGLHELKSIMQAFYDPPHTTVTPTPTTHPPAATADPANTTAKRKATSVLPVHKGPCFVADDAQSVMHETLRHTDDLCSTVAERDGAFLPSTSYDNDAVSSGNGLSECPVSDPATAASSPQLRNLSRDEFTLALQRAVPSATRREIQALLAKAISDNQDTVSWNELSTFLVTCSRQKADLAMEDQRFVLAGQPSLLHLEEQHSESITCVAVNQQRRLVVTGCSSGTVRAWSSGADLAYRGLLLKVEGWIVGLHWGCRGRVLYVVTMDRYVYVLEGTSYEVLRVFHGRGIKGTADGVAYASETIEKVRVGGVALPKHRAAGERGYAGARLRVMNARKGKSLPAVSAVSRGGGGRGGKAESSEDRMHRLLASAVQVRRGMQPSTEGGSDGTGDAAVVAVDAAAGTEGASGQISSVVTGASGATSTAAAATMTTSYSLTTARVAEALHQDSTPLTGAGRGPYVVQRVDEGVLTSLVDAVTATVFEESAFQEDMLLLGTSNGDAFLFVLATQCDLAQRRVLVARHVFTRLHHGLITKLLFSHAFNALLSSGEDGRVRATSLVSGQSLRTFYAPELPEQHASVTDFALHAQLKMLLTIGPERRALVWEWNQPTPIAVLEPVNRPLCCGAFLGEQLLTVSRDRVLHVYDCKSFRLRQELSLGSAGSLSQFSNASSSPASSYTITQLYVDSARQRVLGFDRFPFALCVKRQVSSGCPVRYRGHHAPMFATLISRVFGQLITVGTDGVVMTWTPRTGANEFSFLLSNFSNESAIAGAPMAPVAAAMDVLQRRLLTGFAGGVIVAWNVLNGQVERVLTAAPWSTTTRAVPSAAAAADAVSIRSSNIGGGGDGGVREMTPGSPHARAGSVAPPAPKSDVTAVGSFLRYRSLSYLFAIGRVLYVDAATMSQAAASGGLPASPQLGEYTTTYPSAWAPQPLYGEITQLLQLSPQHVGCGTTSGAVLVYNVLSDCQEGAPLWVEESMLCPAVPHSTASLAASPADTLRGGSSTAAALAALAGSARGRSVSSRREGGPDSDGATRGADSSRLAVPTSGHNTLSTSLNAMSSRYEASAVGNNGAGAGAPQRGYVTARIIRLLSVPAVHSRLLLVAQDDGTLSCWHTLRRVCVGAVNLTAAGLEEDEGVDSGSDSHSPRHRDDARPPGTFVFDLDDEEGELLVFGDGEGNVHVCRMGWQVLSTSSEQGAAMSLPNPLLYFFTADPTVTTQPRAAGVRPSLQDWANDDKAEFRRAEEDEEREREDFPHTPTTATTPDFNEAQRSIPLLRQLERVHVFASGLALAGLRIVDAAAATAFDPAAPMAAAPVGNEDKDLPVNEATAATPADTAPSRQLLIVCTGADHFVRVFTLSGIPIGELGMDEWDVANPRTFRFMGEPMGVPAVPLPCSLQGNPTWQRDTAAVVEASPCYFNYLADLHAAHFPSLALHSSNGGRCASTRHGRALLGAFAYGRRSLSLERAVQAPPLDALGTSLGERVLSPGGTQGRGDSPTDRQTSSQSPERLCTTQLHTAALNAEPTSTAVKAQRVAEEERPAKPGDEAEEEEEAEGGGDHMNRSPLASAAAAATRSLSTRLHRSTRYRYSASPSQQRGVVKPSCVEAVLLRAAAPPTPRGRQPSGVAAVGVSTSPSPQRDVDWVDKEWSVSSLPPNCASRTPLGGEAIADEHLLDASHLTKRRKTSLPRGDSAPANRRSSLASTRGPKGCSAFAASLSADDCYLGDSPFPSAASRVPYNANCDAAPSPRSRRSAAMEKSVVTVATTTPTSPVQQQRPTFPSLPRPLPVTFERSPVASAAPAATRDTRSTLASPVALRTPTKAAESANQRGSVTAMNNNSTSSNRANNNDDANVLALLSRERKRLMASTRTPAARDQLSSLAMPTLFSTAEATAATRSPTKSTTHIQPSPAAAAPVGNVKQHINSLLERRRAHHVCGVPPAAEMRKSAEGYVAHVTSQLYVAPLQVPRTPALTVKRRELSAFSLPSRQRPRSHFGQKL